MCHRSSDTVFGEETGETLDVLLLWSEESGSKPFYGAAFWQEPHSGSDFISVSSGRIFTVGI